MRLIHGDCLTHLRTLPPESIDAVITDPPYGIDYQSTMGNPIRPRFAKIANDRAPFIWFLPELYRVLKDDRCLLCFVRYDVEHDFRWAMRIAGFKDRAQVIWDKGSHGMGDCRGNFGYQHENIIFATKGRFEFPGGRPKTIQRFPKVPSLHLRHPNEKPVDLMRSLIEAVTRPGQVVLDPFMGSAPVGVAAKALRRHYIGIEIDATYYKLAQSRLAANDNAPLSAAS